MKSLHELHINRTQPADTHAAGKHWNSADLWLCFQTGNASLYHTCMFINMCKCDRLPMSKRRNEIQTTVDSVVLDVLPVQSTLVPEILLELLIYVVCDGLPADKHTSAALHMSIVFIKVLLRSAEAHHSLLFTASPNPGVSTMVSLSFTPFSSMSTVCLMISTVWLMRSAKRPHKQKQRMTRF